jgi:hypothetical protein
MQAREKGRPPPSGHHTAPISDQAADPGPAGPTASTQSSSQQAVAVAAIRDRDGCDAGSWMANCCPRRTARRGRAGQPRRCCCRAPAWGRFRQPHAVTSHSRTLSQLALASLAARQGGLRDWLPQCHGHRQRLSCSSSGPMRPHAPVIGDSGGGHPC